MVRRGLASRRREVSGAGPFLRPPPRGDQPPPVAARVGRICSPLAANFNSAAPEGKELCKRFLQQGLGLEVDPERPLVACITRLVPQKGIHLIKHAVHRVAQQGGQFVLLGAGHADKVPCRFLGARRVPTCIQRMHSTFRSQAFRELAQGEFRDSRNVKLLLMYNEQLAHCIYGCEPGPSVCAWWPPIGIDGPVRPSSLQCGGDRDRSLHV